MGGVGRRRRRIVSERTTTRRCRRDLLFEFSCLVLLIFKAT